MKTTVFAAVATVLSFTSFAYANDTQKSIVDSTTNTADIVNSITNAKLSDVPQFKEMFEQAVAQKIQTPAKLKRIQALASQCVLNYSEYSDNTADANFNCPPFNGEQLSIAMLGNITYTAASTLKLGEMTNPVVRKPDNAGWSLVSYMQGTDKGDASFKAAVNVNFRTITGKPANRQVASK